MNIFPTYRDPHASALALDDKRVVRQASEAVIILSTAAHVLGMEDTPYKPHQPGHPLILWIAANRAHYAWTWCYAFACNSIYEKRYGRECKSRQHLRPLAEAGRVALPYIGPVGFHNGARNKALDLDFTHIADPVLAYREYLTARWATDKKAPEWTAGQRPTWLTLPPEHGRLSA